MSDAFDAHAFAAARMVCRRHARSFYFASHFLPSARREAAYAIYAFCRQMDDAVDEANSNESARQNLTHIRSCLETIYASPSPCIREEGRGEGLVSERIFGQQENSPLSLSLDKNWTQPSPSKSGKVKPAIDRAFQLTIQKYAVPRQPFLDLLAGCEMDLSISRYATWPDLELYCYRVAGGVGLIMSRIFSLEREEAQRQAILMGNAMQLTNILRDVGEDFAARGRVYLPADELKRFGYSIDQLSHGIVNTAFVELMRFQIARARAMFREASAGLCWLPNDGSRLTATTMAVIYSGILDAIEQQRYDVFSRRARLSLPQKLARLTRCWRLARREPGTPLPDFFNASNSNK